MPHDTPSAEDAALLRSVAQQPFSKRIPVYLRLSGPGWLQSALTLGGASLSGSLYLGVLGGFGLLWLQPFAMIIGIVMLCAVGYVTIATGRRPLEAINEHVSPVLGVGWAIASLLASMVWAMPQYSLAIGVLQQNLMPGLLGANGPFGSFGGKLVPTLVILAVSTAITWNYGKPGPGVKLYETVLKVMVGAIVLCFAGVVARIAFSPAGLDWGAVLRGFLPDFSLLTRPADAFQPLIAATAPGHQAYWTDLIVGKQRDIIVAAAAGAVGINMTFLFPYSLLRRGWSREFSGLMGFDLATGMLIPFTLATSFVVIAAASQFHAMPQPGIAPSNTAVVANVGASPLQLREYRDLLQGVERQQVATGAVANLSPADEQLAATLVTRDAYHLASALEPLTGAFVGRVIFSLGVLGMTLSTITLMMVISGQVICALFGREQTGWLFRISSLLAVSGALGPFLWGKAAFYLAIPASIFGFILLPIAYLSFFLLMNQRRLLGEAMPRGSRRVVGNVLMGVSVLAAGTASAFMLYTKSGVWGLGIAGAFLVAAAATQRVGGR
ncbi:MAG TPA: divalent metal cation transporter [Opitutaceae bacterium]